MLVILGLSSVPHLTPPATWGPSDKAAHLAEYGVLGFLLRRALGRRTFGSWLLAGGIAVAIGTADEFYQSTVPGRFPSALDGLADLCGGLAGGGIQGWWSSRRRERADAKASTERR